MKCPTCESTLVIEIDELSTLNVENDTPGDLLENVTKNQHSVNPAKSDLQHSGSSSSIGKFQSVQAISVIDISINTRMNATFDKSDLKDTH